MGELQMHAADACGRCMWQMNMQMRVPASARTRPGLAEGLSALAALSLTPALSLQTVAVVASRQSSRPPTWSACTSPHQ